MATITATIIAACVLAPSPLVAAPSYESCLEGPWPSANVHLDNRAPARRAQPPAANQSDSPSDRRVDPSEPDFTLVNLPTGLALPRFGSAFRVTHRFTRPISEGTVGELFEDLLGVDNGARVGLEYRFAPMRAVQAGVHRSSDRTIEIFGQARLLRESSETPFSASLVLSVDGANNFRQDYSPSIGAILSRRFGNHGAVYLEPRWIRDRSSDTGGAGDLLLLGIGTRVRVRPSLYVVAELAPRVGLSDQGMPPASVAIEKRLGGHSFQFTVSNTLATTIAPLARERTASDVWHIGFSISRKFY